MAKAPAPMSAAQGVIPGMRPLRNLKLTFADVYSFSTAVGYAVRSFRMNSIFDPDLTGVGGAPTYYSQLAGIYDKYLVRSVDLDFEFVNTAALKCLVGLIPHTTGESPVSSATEVQQLLLEGKHTTYAWLSPASYDGARARLKLHLDFKSFVGPSFEDDDYWSKFGQNPFGDLDLDVVIIDPATAASTLTCDYIARITYHTDVAGVKGSTYQD